MTAPSTTAMAAIRAAIAPFVYRVRTEAELQDQVALALDRAGLSYQRELRAAGARFDLQVRAAATVVLELKLHATAAAVERQAQRYAMMPDVDAVIVVTTSSRLAHQLPHATLGGKPFAAIAVRTS